MNELKSIYSGTYCNTTHALDISLEGSEGVWSPFLQNQFAEMLSQRVGIPLSVKAIITTVKIQN